MNLRATSLFLGLFLIADAASAAVFCVTTPAALSSALLTASANGEADTIRVHQGNYLLTQELTYVSNENNNLTISGGWLSIPTACAVQFMDASVTVIDGQGTSGGIRLNPIVTNPGTYTVSNLTITRTTAGLGTQTAGIYGNFSGSNEAATLDLSNLIIRNNNAPLANDVGVRVFGRAHVRVRNTLIADNQSEGLVGLSYDNGIGPGSVYLQHLTIANNQSILNAYAGVDVAGDALLTMENSIVWANTSANPQGNCALSVTNADRLRFVIASNICGQQSGSNIGVNSFNPKFIDADFRIAFDSPAINVGLNPPAMPLIPKDIDNNNRVLGPKPDLGVYESTELFRNGFE